MYFDERENFVRAERFKDWQRKTTEHHLLSQTVRHEHLANKIWFHSLTNWLGTQMVKWGSKLQQYDSVSPPKVASTK